jgi:hypothetical protein
MEEDKIVRKPLEKRSLGSPMYRLNDNIKWNVIGDVN